MSTNEGTVNLNSSEGSTSTAPVPTPTAPLKPLNVKDALMYLDNVKQQFSDQQDVYDKFLNIMKDFKAQVVDTPGVIDQVSSLFRGHPSLIVGFNTFLPNGYRIECSVSTQSATTEGGITTITVTTPMGIMTSRQLSASGENIVVPPPTATGATATTTTTAVAPNVIVGEEDIDPSLRASSKATTSITGSTLPVIAVESTRPDTVMNAAPPPHLHTLPPFSSSVPTSAAPALSQPSATIPTPSALPLPMTKSAAAAAASIPPMEFNHAINYVNKIKNRFVRDPDTYKAFLEILQTYQKEGKAIQDVYAQVTVLFHTAPDLLHEFKQFLPDTGPVVPEKPARGTKRPAKKDGEGNSAKKPKAVPRVMKSVEEKTKPKRGKNDARDSRKAAAVEAAYLDPSAHPLDSVYHQSSGSTGGYAPPPPLHSSSSQLPHPTYAYEAPPHPPAPLPILAPKPQASAPDVAFFSRVKEFFNDVPTYHEFLKLLNLYTQDILDLTALVSRAYLFLGPDPTLWREFREIVGWNDGMAMGEAGGRVEIVDGVRIVENVPRIAEAGMNGRGDSGKGRKTYGPSYRQLPQSEISLNCSGRDALCWDVLNDEWISQPNRASDEGFVAHRKNPYEEALHRSEEERHEYDYHIEANLRTMALLEPIATRMAIMEADERATFRLKPGLGNQSKSIYQRVIKKIYGREQAGEVMIALHENPCVAVPIVLARLKQKDEEWKRALREWNRVWKEVDAKNFWKSLDHQALAIKSNDKRSLNLKALVAEIETLRREQRQRTIARVGPAPTAQLTFDLSDRDVLSDTIKLTFAYLDRMPALSAPEKDRVDGFIRSFLPLVFAISPEEFALDSAALVLPRERDEDDQSNDGMISDAGTSGVEDAASVDSSTLSVPAVMTPGMKRLAGKRAAADLRKLALLKNAAGGGAGGSGTGEKGTRDWFGRKSKASSRAASPAVSNDGDAIMAEVESTTAPEAEVEGTASVGSVGGETEGLSVVGASEDPVVETTDTTPVSAEGSITPVVEGVVAVDSAPVVAVGSEASTSTAPIVVAEAIGTPVAAVPVIAPTGLEMAGSALPELIVPTDDRPVLVDVRRKWNFFAHSNMYCLLRLFEVVYRRLSALKHSAATLSTAPRDLEITAAHVPSLSLAMTISPSTSSANAAQYYERALSLCERLFDGEIDQTAFEEKMRGMFGMEGYVFFGLDKILSSIIKQCQTGITDSKSQDLLELLQQDRAHPDRSTSQQQIFYRSQAESAIGSDENLYRFEWFPTLKRLSVQLLGKDSLAAEDSSVAEREWATYLENFVLNETTLGVDASKLRPFLSRNLRLAAPNGTAAFPSHLTVKSALQCKICLRSYRIFFVSGTEDYLHRGRSMKATKGYDNVAATKRLDEWSEARKAVLAQSDPKGAVINVLVPTKGKEKEVIAVAAVPVVDVVAAVATGEKDGDVTMAETEVAAPIVPAVASVV